MVSCQQMLEAINAHRSQAFCNNQNLEPRDDVATEQMARIYQDLCNYNVPQRSPCYRENMPITA